MKIAIYSPYLETYGGGERYVFSVAKYFLDRDNQVVIFSSGKLDKTIVKQRLGIDIDKAILEDKIRSFGFDYFFALSDGSIPFTLAKHSWLHFQSPFNYSDQKSLWNKIKLKRYETIICNSFYTKKVIDHTYDVKSIVLYPPVDTLMFKPGKKTNTILSVGRFFADPHQKKQEVMIDVFRKMVKDGLNSWELVLFGGVSADKENQMTQLLDSIQGLPIKIVTNGPLDLLTKYYSEAAIYWHATGYGEDLIKYPDRAEHFGITTVEAMAAGAVPIVYNGGGQTEIINDGKTGFLWQTKENLNNQTLKIIRDNKLRHLIAAQAEARAKDFSQEVFANHLASLCEY